MSIFLFYEKIFNIAKNFKEAEEWDIHQVINMSVDERIKAAKELEIFFYGKDVPDARESKFFKCKKVNLQRRFEISL